MSLRLLTASGALTLGDPPLEAVGCDFCPATAQVQAGPDEGSHTFACAACAERILLAAPHRGDDAPMFPMPRMDFTLRKGVDEP